MKIDKLNILRGLLLASVYVSSATASPVTAKSLKIGVIASLTGDASNNGNSIKKGVELATDELKSAGWSVQVDYQDDGTIPVRTVSALRYLLGQKYRLFVGPTWSFEVNAARQVLEKAGAIALVPAGSSDINGASSSAIFNLCPSRAEEFNKIVEWLKGRSYKKAFILTPLGDWGVVHRDVFTRAAKAAGLEIAGDQQFDYGIEPMALQTLLLKAKMTGSDLILTTAGAGDIGNMLKVRAAIEWKAGFLTTEDLWDTLDGGLVPENQTMLSDTWAIGLPLNREFSQKFKLRFKESPKMYADRAYDAVMLLAAAIEKSDGSPDSIRKLLSNNFHYTGVTGEITFNDKGDKSSEEYKVMQALNNKDRT